MTKKIQAIETEPLQNALQNLTQDYNALRAHILHSSNVFSGMTFCEHTGRDFNGGLKEQLIKAFGDWLIRSDSTSGEVNRYIGVFLADNETLSFIQAFNEAKQVLTDVTKQLTKAGAKDTDLRTAYTRAGYPTLHPLQARRRVHIIDGSDLTRISFSVAKNIESIQRVSIERTRTTLIDNDCYDILHALDELPPDSIVRWHRPVATHVRANIVRVHEDGTRHSNMIHASLPFAIINTDTLPKVVFNKPKPRNKNRSDTLNWQKIPLPFIDKGYISFAP